ncbi:amino acid ABC transporter ATP-binding protein [Paracoccus onubensis]|uniref:Amino acid ABC transporter ATP-binding protein n=1 Tax=Paracoccus onubensis TaxID=1675788 RepID=A0A418T265_9RHOB|nr:amino acid ABC transporter ATP-binding protein [Paracoccus onubensis]RJE87263.1 amino acid ABC transporter ATP-binding protein [Paracoccus onubensis]
MSFIEIENLTKDFGEFRALNGVSFQLEEGKTAAIIGSSGCGKSTFLRCLNMLETPTEARLRIGDKEVRFSNGQTLGKEREAFGFRREMAMVFQSFDLFPHMTALQNVALAPNKVRKLPRKQAEQQALQLLDRMGLRAKAGSYPTQLSGGQQQRVAIARALAMEPKVLLFDEATSALDPELVGEVLDVMKVLAQDGRTMIVVTHELHFARDVADVLIYFDKGQIAEIGPPAELLANPKTDRLKSFLTRYNHVLAN